MIATSSVETAESVDKNVLLQQLVEFMIQKIIWARFQLHSMIVYCPWCFPFPTVSEVYERLSRKCQFHHNLISVRPVRANCWGIKTDIHVL